MREGLLGTEERTIEIELQRSKQRKSSSGRSSSDTSSREDSDGIAECRPGRNNGQGNGNGESGLKDRSKIQNIDPKKEKKLFNLRRCSTDWILARMM